MVIIEIYGNVSPGVPLSTGQMWRTELTERMVSCTSPSLQRQRKITRESEANRKYCSPRKVEAISQQLEMQRTGK